MYNFMCDLIIYIFNYRKSTLMRDKWYTFLIVGFATKCLTIDFNLIFSYQPQNVF